MNEPRLPDFLLESYEKLKGDIRKRLKEFAEVYSDDYFYELCFCLLTPQSKAKSAIAAVEELKKDDFYQTAFNPTEILRNPKRYVRFHNQKAKRLLDARKNYSAILSIIKSDTDAKEKRNTLAKTVCGFGLKEASHFLRNIGYRDLAILDRHILKHLALCGVLNGTPKVGSPKAYFEIEDKFLDFAEQIGVSIDELDLLFWSYETGEILK